MKKFFFISFILVSFYSPAQKSCFDAANKYRKKYLDQSGIDFDSLTRHLEIGQNMMIGCTFPNDTFTNVKGKKLSIDAFKGKMILIDYWSIHCPPCINEIASLHTLQKKFKEELVILSFTLDSKREIEAWLQKHEFNVEVIPEAGYFMKEYSLDNPYPFTWLIDKHKKILHIKSGGSVEAEHKMDLYNEFAPIIEKALKTK